MRTADSAPGATVEGSAATGCAVAGERGAEVLPDVIGPGLRVVFCGTAVGSASARSGAYYAGLGNRFWRTLHEIGLTPHQLRPADFASALEYGIGLTDVCKTRSGSDVEIGTKAFDVAGLEALIGLHAPGVIAFKRHEGRPHVAS